VRTRSASRGCYPAAHDASPHTPSPKRHGGFGSLGLRSAVLRVRDREPFGCSCLDHGGRERAGNQVADPRHAEPRL